MPRVTHVSEVNDLWHVELIEWFPGLTFKQMRKYGIPDEAFFEFGLFVKDCDDRKIGIGDCILANVLHTFRKGITFMCDVDMFNRDSQKYIPVCVNKILRGITREQERAFYRGYGKKD